MDPARPCVVGVAAEFTARPSRSARRGAGEAGGQRRKIDHGAVAGHAAARADPARRPALGRDTLQIVKGHLGHRNSPFGFEPTYHTPLYIFCQALRNGAGEAVKKPRNAS